MSLPEMIIEEVDNQLGQVEPSDGDTIAAIACCANPAYPLNLPAFFSDAADAKAQLIGGALCEWVCFELEHHGGPVLAVASDSTTDGVLGTLVTTGVAGTSVVTVDTAVKPWDDYEVIVRVKNGGTIGTTGIVLEWSLDGGRGKWIETSLGTANNITLADDNAGNCKFAFAAGTLVTGDTWTAVAVGPSSDDAALADACEGLRTTMNDFDLVFVNEPLDASSVAVLDAKAKLMSTLGREVAMIGSFRWPNAGETEQQYLAAWRAAFDSTVATHCSVWAGAVDAQSPISQRQYRRRSAWDAAVAAVSVGPGQDLAEKGIGPRPPAVTILGPNLNPRHHNELLSPGLDNARASTYRTWFNKQGTFVGNPRLLGAANSDFKFLQHRRVMNHAKRVVRRVLEEYSSADIVVNAKTGFILDEQANDIDIVVNAALQLELTDEREASDVVFRLRRDENILSTLTLRGPLQVTPLAYAKLIKVTAGFYNPALKVVKDEG